MGKLLTPSLGYQVDNNNNLGQMNSIGGGQWLGYDPSMGAIRQKLGSDTFNLSLNATHPSINKWAHYKPYHHNFRNSFGLDYLNNWAYVIPTTDWRKGDFIGYNHNARVPGIITPSGGKFYEGAGTHSVGMLVTLPEFDVRTLNPTRIKGTVTHTPSGWGFVEITNAAQSSGQSLVNTMVTTQDTVSHTFTVTIWLGEDDIHGPEIFCDFPHAGTGELQTSVTIYRFKNDLTLTQLPYVDGKTHISCVFKELHPNFLLSYELQQVFNYPSNPMYMPLYQGTNTSYVLPDVTPYETYYFRSRMHYDKGTGAETTPWTEVKGIYIEPDLGGGGAQ